MHDPRHEGSKTAVGHFYALNLHSHTLRHLAAGEGLHEHDMSALKRIKPKGLRQEVPKGTRVVLVYDKAGIDFDYWNRCRRECAVNYISRVKGNTVVSGGTKVVGFWRFESGDIRGRFLRRILFSSSSSFFNFCSSETRSRADKDRIYANCSKMQLAGRSSSQTITTANASATAPDRNASGNADASHRCCEGGLHLQNAVSTRQSASVGVSSP